MTAPILHRSMIIIAASVVLAACTSSGAPPAPSPAQSPTGVTPNTFVLPSAGGCAGEVARFQAVMDNDLATGHTTQGVHARVSAEIAGARATCSGGNDGAAVAQINATKSKFGYR